MGWPSVTLSTGVVVSLSRGFRGGTVLTMYDVTAALGALPEVFTTQTAMTAGISHHVLRR